MVFYSRAVPKVVVLTMMLIMLEHVKRITDTDNIKDMTVPL